jgi:hypothetical protein
LGAALLARTLRIVGRQDRVTSTRGDGFPEEHSPQGVRIRVGATHRKLPTYRHALLDAGPEAERFAEPPAPVPTCLLWRCRRRQLGVVTAPGNAVWSKVGCRRIKVLPCNCSVYR